MSIRYIPITITNEVVSGDGVSIGAVGSNDDVVLQISFNYFWDGLSKHATWENANGEKTIVYFTSEMYSEGAYNLPVPVEAKRYEGEVNLSIRGTLSGRSSVSARASFTVSPSIYDSTFEEESQPTPTIADQLQEQIDALDDSVSTELDSINSELARTIEGVQINGTDLPVVNKKANIPLASPTNYGAIKIEAAGDPPRPSARLTTDWTPSYLNVSNVDFPLIRDDGTISAYFIPDATQAVKGAMSASDKAKLDSVAVFTGATETSAGSVGLVPAPTSGKDNTILVGSGHWGTIYPQLSRTTTQVRFYFDTDYTGAIMDYTLGAATTTQAGVMSSGDKTKLDNIKLKNIYRGGGSPSNPYVVLEHDALSGAPYGGSDFTQTTVTWIPYLVQDSSSNEYLKIPKRFLPEYKTDVVKTLTTDNDTLYNHNRTVTAYYDGDVLPTVRLYNEYSSSDGYTSRWVYEEFQVMMYTTNDHPEYGEHKAKFWFNNRASSNLTNLENNSKMIVEHNANRVEGGNIEH